MPSYVLADEIVLRKEYFGALVLNLLTYRYHQFNPDGALILEKLISPLDFNELLLCLSEEGFILSREVLGSFVGQCLKDRIVRKTDSNQKSKAGIFFWDREDVEFNPNYLFRPTNVSIYLTRKCTKCCVHCVTEATPHEMENELSLDEWKKILRKLREEGVLAVVFTGGEPFLRKDLQDILEYANSLKFKITLLTDYDNLSVEHVEFLKSLKYLSGIQVSLDGACAETHDFLRGKGSFNLAMKRLNLLNESGIRYAISTTVHRKNIPEIDGIVDIYHKYNASVLWLNPLAPFGRGKKLNEIVLSNQELMLLSDKYLELVRSGRIDAGNDYWLLESELSSNADKRSPLQDTPNSISLGVFNVSIGSDGGCYLDSKMMSGDVLPLGNILEMSLGEIWNMPGTEKVRSYYDGNAEEACFRPLCEVEELADLFATK